MLKMIPIKLGHTYKAKPYFVLLMNSIGGIPQQQNQHTKARERPCPANVCSFTLKAAS